MKESTLKPSQKKTMQWLEWIKNKFKHEPDEVVAEQKRDNIVKSLGKKHAALILQYTAIEQKVLSLPESGYDNGVLNNAVLKYLFAEKQKGLITDFLHQVSEHEPEQLATLQNNLAHYVHGAIDQMLSSTADDTCLSMIIEHIFDFADITNTSEGSLSTGLQDVVVSRVRKTVQQAAERQLQSILKNKGQREALAYPDQVNQHEICRKMGIKDFLLDHLVVDYNPKKN